MTYDMTDLQADGAQDTEKMAREPRTAAGRALLEKRTKGEPLGSYARDYARDILAIEAEAAGSPKGLNSAPSLSQHGELREALVWAIRQQRHMYIAGPSALAEAILAVLTARQSEATTPAPEPFYDSDGIPIPDELFAAMESASSERSDPAPLDVDPWDQHSDPARRFAYWFTSAPMQRQIEFIREWGRQHPDDLARLTARAAVRPTGSETTEPDGD